MKASFPIKRFLAIFLPSPVKRFIKKALGSPKRLGIYCRAIRQGSITRQYLVERLQQLGLKKGIVVAVHSSLSRLGYVKGGPSTVVEALLQAVGKEGTVLMPTFTGFSELTKSQVFDVRKSASKLGAVSEAFRKMPNAKRSLHPTHSFAAIGPKAEFLLAGQAKSEKLFGKGTPLCRLMDLNGFVLCLGIGIEMMSLYHVAEDQMRFTVKVYRDGTVSLAVVDCNGQKQTVETSVHDEKVHDRFLHEEGAVHRVEAELRKRDCLKSLRIGQSQSYLMPAKKTVETLKEMARKGNTWYGRG